MFTVVGWGARQFPGDSVNLPFKADVNQTDPGQCKESFADLGGIIIEEAITCTISPERKNVCQGDSGGPNYYTNANGQLVNVAVTSFGEECGQSGYPSVNTKVHYHLDWIQENIPIDSSLCLADTDSFHEYLE